jgi:hypothetical protein
MISTEYDLREQQQKQKLLLLPDDEQNAKRIKSVEHSKTKGQMDMMGVQLVDAMEEFDQDMILPNWDMESHLFHWPTCLAGGTRARGTWLIRWKEKIIRLQETHGSN